MGRPRKNCQHCGKPLVDHNGLGCDDVQPSAPAQSEDAALIDAAVKQIEALTQERDTLRGLLTIESPGLEALSAEIAFLKSTLAERSAEIDALLAALDGNGDTQTLANVDQANAFKAERDAATIRRVIGWVERELSNTPTPFVRDALHRLLDQISPGDQDPSYRRPDVVG